MCVTVDGRNSCKWQQIDQISRECDYETFRKDVEGLYKKHNAAVIEDLKTNSRRPFDHSY
jgi:hypothetical protein